MKRLSGVLILSVFLLFSAHIVFADETGFEIDEIVAKWTHSLINEDLDGFLSCYWDDAVRLVYFPGQEPEITEGMEELGASEKAAFDDMDFGSMNLIYDEPVRFFPENGRPTYVYPNSRFTYMDVFEFEKRRGEYRIIKQYLLPHPPGE